MVCGNLLRRRGVSKPVDKLGRGPKLESETVWFGAQWDERLCKSWDELSDVKLDEDNKWWRLTKNITEVASRAMAGYGIVGMTDLGGILDIVASLRGSKRLLVDLRKNPKAVKSLSSKIIDIWHACYEELNSIISRYIEGSSAWMGI